MDIDVNIIRSVFGKGEENLLDWLKRGMATYINEKKTLDFLHHSDLLSEALKNQESSSAAAKLNKIGELNKFLGEKNNVSGKSLRHSALHDEDKVYAAYERIENIVENAIKIGDIPVSEDEIGKTTRVKPLRRVA